MPSIIIDIDGVLADHVDHLIRRFREMRILPEDFTKENVDRWDSIIGGLKFRDAFESQIIHDEFILGMPPIDGSVDAVNKLYEEYRVILVSARPRYTEESTIKWLKMHGYRYNELYIDIGEERVQIGGEVLIDDNPYTTVKFAERGGISIIYAQPWNNIDTSSLANIGDRIFRIGSWDRIVSLINEILGR